MVSRLVDGMDPLRFENRLISMTEVGILGERLARTGIAVRAIGMGRVPGPLGVARLARQVRQDAPDIVQTWLYAADLVAGLAARSVGHRNVVWNIRQSAPQRHLAPRRHVWTARACAATSSFLPRAILSCSEEARRSHEALGYPKDIVVIPNGYDLSVLGCDPEAAGSVRAELGLDFGTPLIGMVARFDPVKGHHDFFDAAAQVSRHRPDVHFLLCGRGVIGTNPQLAQWTRSSVIDGRAHLLGHRDDVPRLLAALDVFVSASHSEGFPNAIAEAMASSVPCVVTDVGDSASLVGSTGRTVPPRSSRDLASAIISVLSLPLEARADLGSAARRRVEQYSMPIIVDRYSRFYEELVKKPGQELQTTCSIVA